MKKMATHVKEMIALHDFSRDNTSGSKEELFALIRNELQYQAVHHHVFDFELVNKMLQHFSLQRNTSKVALFICNHRTQ